MNNDYLPALDKFIPHLDHAKRYATLSNARELLEAIRSRILDGIGNDDKLASVDFCDVSAGYIQVHAVHVDEKGYAHFHLPLKYDLSNADQLVSDFVATWKKQREVSYSTFYREGERWGWD